MSKQASAFQEKVMSFIYRGEEHFKPLNTGALMIDNLFAGDTIRFGTDGGRSLI